jgi:chromosome segregation ATPase
LIKINKFEIENVKRVKAVKVEPAANGLTIIGGKNNQGKTSVLDAIAWALGGDKYRPSQAQRDKSVLPPALHIVMSNGLIVERKGKNADLKVIDPSGQKGGQQLLNDFVERLALDLPRFMGSTNKEKANTLLQIIGVQDTLTALEREETEFYNRRHTIGQIADQKKKFAAEQPYFPDAPKEPVAASELIKQQQDILARNGENERKRRNLQYLENQAADIQRHISELMEKQKGILADLEIARKSAVDLHDESTAELEANIANIETINRKVRANLDKDKAEEDAKDYEAQYNTLTAQINDVRQKKIDLLKGASLPLPGLSVEDGELTYNGYRWDSMSGSDQLKVSTAIVRKLNPKCRYCAFGNLH